MNNLKETIENTLINNLETTAVFAGIDLESIQRCSDYIAQEIRESFKDFGNHLAGYYIMRSKGNVEDKDLYTIVDEFINQRYKKES